MARGFRNQCRFLPPRGGLIWLLSYASPFVFQLLVLLLFGEQETTPSMTALFIFGPSALGFLGAFAALVCTRLSTWQFVARFMATMLAFLFGLAFFTLFAILFFGVVAT